MAVKLNARQLRDLDEKVDISPIKRFPIFLIIDNIYDTYNIGGLFRLADALAYDKIIICGESETPPNHRIAKASIGTDKIVPWEYKKTALEAIEELRNRNEFGSKDDGFSHSYGQKVSSSGLKITKTIAKTHTSSQTKNPLTKPITIVCIEQHPSAVPYTQFDYQLPIAFVVGNETTGVSKEALKASDAIVEIPMFGINKSLNVIVSAAIVAYHVYQLFGFGS